MADHACCSGPGRLFPLKSQHKPIPTVLRQRSALPPLLPQSASQPDSTPGLDCSLFPTSKVGHCLLCIIQQLE